MTTDNHHTPSATAARTQDQPGHLSHYQRGRNYVAAIAKVMTSVYNRNSPDAISHDQALADTLLWPLDTANADQLRDFIAGLNREAENQVELLAVTRSPSPDLTRLAESTAAAVTQILNRNGICEEVRTVLDRLQMCIQMTGHPRERDRSFYDLGALDFDLAEILAEVDEHDFNEDEAHPDHRALSDAREQLHAFLDHNHTDRGTHYRAFIAGQQFAHGLHLY